MDWRLSLSRIAHRGEALWRSWAAMWLITRDRYAFLFLWSGLEEGQYFHLLSDDSINELVESIDVLLNCFEALLYSIPFPFEVRLQQIDITDDQREVFQRLF